MSSRNLPEREAPHPSKNWDQAINVPETASELRAEFEAHIWNHADDVFQKSFDEAIPLNPSEYQFLERIVGSIRDGADDSAIAALLRAAFTVEAELLPRLLQLVGLTRNKILQDLKAWASTRDVRPRIPADAIDLPRRDAAWDLAGPYLVTAVRRTLTPLAPYPDVRGVFQALNVATWPGYIRQERAKRQGHEAEGRIARLLLHLDIPFEPKGKAANPLGGDVRIGEISFDIVSPSLNAPYMVVKSTVQTANIGQFGESKTALEIEEARTMLEARFRTSRPVLLAFLDGVGFRSNSAGLDGALRRADEFAQFRSIWKAAAIAAAGVNGHITIGLPADDSARHSAFLGRWQRSVTAVPLTRDFRAQQRQGLLVEAGEAFIRRDS